MTPKTFQLEIITPNRLAFSETVESVQIPTVEGEIGILPFHTALFSQITEGEVVIMTLKGPKYLSVGGGFLEFNKNKATLLVTRAYHADELDEKAILQAQKEAQEALKRKPVAEELYTAQSLLRSSLIDLKVARRRKAPRL